MKALLGNRYRVLFAIGAILVGLLAAAPAQAAPRCQGQPVTIAGTQGDDNIIGTDRRDVILAKGGTDTIWGEDGNDYLCGGGGGDTLYGRAGDDSLDVGPAPSGVGESAHGGSDDDIMSGTLSTSVQAFGGSGDDKFVGSPGPDTVEGGSGDDIAVGMAGNDSLGGGSGDDELFGDLGDADEADGGDGWDSCDAETETNCEAN